MNQITLVRILTSFLLLFVFSTASYAKIITKSIKYKDGKQELQGFIAYDESIKGKLPGVLVVHEWWGHNEHAKNKAIALAKQGYVGFALDMYGKGVLANHPDDAKKFSSQFSANKALASSRFDAAYKVLSKHAKVNTRKIGAIGFCFGGGIVLAMARKGKDLKAVASFHGALATDKPAKKGKVKASIYVAHGKQDKMITMQQVDAIKKEMANAGVKLTVDVFDQATHSFTNPGADEFAKKFKMPVGYNKKADEESWANMLKVFSKALK